MGIVAIGGGVGGGGVGGGGGGGGGEGEGCSATLATLHTLNAWLIVSTVC